MGDKVGSVAGPFRALPSLICPATQRAPPSDTVLSPSSRLTYHSQSESLLTVNQCNSDDTMSSYHSLFGLEPTSKPVRRHPACLGTPKDGHGEKQETRCKRGRAASDSSPLEKKYRRLTTKAEEEGKDAGASKTPKNTRAVSPWPPLPDDTIDLTLSSPEPYTPTSQEARRNPFSFPSRPARPVPTIHATPTAARVAGDPSSQQEKLALLREKTGYIFTNVELARAALGMTELSLDHSGRRLKRGMPTSCQNLAIVGDLVLELALADKWFEIASVPVTWTCVKDIFTSNAALKRFCVKSQLSRCYGGPRDIMSSNVWCQGTLVEAVLGAIYLDSGKSLGVVQTALEWLGIMHEAMRMLEALEQAVTQLSHDVTAPALLASDLVQKMLKSGENGESNVAEKKKNKEQKQKKKVVIEISESDDDDNGGVAIQGP